MHNEVVAPRRDIVDRDDLWRLVRSFYTTAMADDRIGFLFTEVAELDLEAHLPVMVDFWQTMVLGEARYGGGAFPVHLRLHEKEPLTPDHFARWVEIWHGTVDELFEGPRADHAKAHGDRVASAFSRRLSSAEPGLVQISQPGTG